MTGVLPDYSKLRAITTLTDMPVDIAVQMAARLIDGASDMGCARDLEQAIKLITNLQESGIGELHVARLHYFIGNAWSAIRQIQDSNQLSAWNWHRSEFAYELLSLRRAAHSSAFQSLPSTLCSEVKTNIGNLLSTIGRPLEAVDAYNEALEFRPGFGMALANRGLAIKALAMSHYDEGQRDVLLHFAWNQLTSANKSDLVPGANEYFQQEAAEIERWFSRDSLEKRLPLDEYKLGDSEDEQRYRKWALQERLFLNPLQAIGPHSAVANDVLGIPSVVVGVNEGPGLVGLFNLIKQEYVSARYFAWEGTSAIRGHFADKETHLIDTLDYPVYGIGVERTKVAFRMAYSILDKCSFLLNKYFDLGISDRAINMNTLWFVDGRPPRQNQTMGECLNQKIVGKPNLPLRGLFWLARDIRDPDELRDPIDPAAQGLKDIRDHLEHKYLKVHDLLLNTNDKAGWNRDQYAYSIKQMLLERKTINLLRLARSAITYSSLAIHSAEKAKLRKMPLDAKIGSIALPKVLDTWKR